MSAWLCRNKTLSLCVDVLKEECGYINDNLTLLTELSLLNTKSLDCRYGKNDEYHVLHDKEYIKLDVDDGQKHKSVCFYLYQTCECPENEKHSLYKALNDWSLDNEEKYNAVWDNYHWDIDNPAPRRI